MKYKKQCLFAFTLIVPIVTIAALAPVIMLTGCTTNVVKSEQFNNNILELNNYQNFSPTTINKNGFYDYASSLDGINAPDYKFFDQATIVEAVATTPSKTTEWALINGVNTFKQIFINDSVATYFAKLAGKTLNDSVIAGDLTTINAAITANGSKCDLSGLYRQDKYRDETIKAINNPNLNDMFADCLELDISANTLWFVPFIGFYPDSFKILKILNLQNNFITHIPVHVESRLISKFNVDLTTKSTLENILISGNLLAKFKLQEDKYENWNKFNYIKEVEETQSTWVYSNDKILGLYVKNQLTNAFNIQPDKMSLNKEYTDISGKQRNVYEYINEIIEIYYQNNHLGSSVVYNLNGSPSSSSSAVTIYIFSSINANSGEYLMTLEFKDFQYYNYQTKLFETTAVDQFIEMSFAGFKQDYTIEILAITFGSIIGLSVIAFAVYIIVFKKKIVSKRKQKDLRDTVEGAIRI